MILIKNNNIYIIMYYYDNLYFNDILLQKYLVDNANSFDSNLKSTVEFKKSNSIELNNLRVYNTTIKEIINQINLIGYTTDGTIMIHDNDSGLIGWALNKLGIKCKYIRKSTVPNHAVLISSFVEEKNIKKSNNDIYLHFIITNNDVRNVNIKQKNIIFCTDKFISLFKLHNIKSILL
jgi:hypothetical protein